MHINARDRSFCYGHAWPGRNISPGHVRPRQEELNVFGSSTGKVEHVREGERLPLAPRGFTWRHLEDDGC
jgi:hypothetical protein